MSFQDGAGPGLKAQTNEPQLNKDEVLKVIANKHSSTTAATQQATDVCPCFKIVKAFCKNTTAEHLPAFGYKSRVIEEIEKLISAVLLTIQLPIKKALVDHLVTAPEIFTRGMCRKKIIKGFVENGMIDSKKLFYPDVDSMVRTCKLKDLSQTNENLIFNNFSVLYKETKENGVISEETFDHLGFPQDTDLDGKEVIKTVTITNEMQQRAKIISSRLQRQLRNKKRKKPQAPRFRKKKTRC